MGAKMDTAMDLYGTAYAAHKMQHVTQLRRHSYTYEKIEQEKKKDEHIWNHGSVPGASPDGRR